MYKSSINFNQLDNIDVIDKEVNEIDKIILNLLEAKQKLLDKRNNLRKISENISHLSNKFIINESQSNNVYSK